MKVPALASAALAIGFWWLATGMLFALQNGPASHAIVLVATAGLAALGTGLILFYRNRTTARSAQFGFLGGALLWTWVQAGLYGGWLVGPPLVPTATATDRLAFMLEAIRATIWSDAAGLVVLGAAAVAANQAANKAAFYSILLLWFAHQFARLNVFFGVVNPGADLLPPHLMFLSYYFGPQHNSLLLPISILTFAALAWYLFRSGRLADSHTRQLNVLLGTLALLASLEFTLLGLPVRLPLWRGFLHTPSGQVAGPPLAPPPNGLGG